MLVFLLLLADLVGLASLLGSAYDVIAVGVFPVLWGAGLILATAGTSREERSVAARLFTVSFLLRVGVAMAVYRLGILGTLGDDDSSGWYAGWGIAQFWKGDPQFAGIHADFMQALRHANQGYYFLAGGVLYLIGAPSRISLAFLSAFVGGLTTILIYRITGRIAGRETAEKAGLLAAFFPSLVVWSAQTLKEPFVVFFECVVVSAVLALRARGSLRVLLLLLASLFCLYTMRFYAAYLSAAAATMVLLWRTDTRRAQTPLMAGLILSVAVLALFASGLWKTETERLTQFNLAWLETFRMNVSSGSGGQSGILLPYDVSTPVGVLAAFPLSLLAFLLSPFPWQALEGSARLKFAMVDVLMWYWFIPKIVDGLREAWRTHRATVGHLMLFVLPFTVFYTLIFGNAGLAFRERGQILVLLIVFGAMGLAQRKPREVSSDDARHLQKVTSAVGVAR